MNNEIDLSLYDPVTFSSIMPTGNSGIASPGWTSVPNFTSHWQTSAVPAQGTLTIDNGAGMEASDIMLNRPGKDKLAVGKTLDAIMDRLCIIEPSFKLMDKYPALKEAYDAYKAIEALCRTGDNEDE